MDLDRAVSATLSYASYFRFPLFPDELHHWLVTSTPVSFSRLRPHLPPALSASAQTLRSQTAFYTAQKTLHAQKLVGLLRFVPGLRLVALTGSVAAQNSQPDDDIDLLFITDPHVLWLVRPLVIGLIALFFRRRHPQEDHSHTPDAFCPNLWLDTFSLAISSSKHSLYTAHEVLQIVPLLDRGGTYQSFLKANRWTQKYLANAYSSLTSKHTLPVIPAKADIHQINFLIFIFLFPLNYLFFLFQLFYMSSKKTSETVHLHAAFLHTTDFSSQLDDHLKDLNGI